jgi:serine/threonine-protein kinase HipA
MLAATDGHAKNFSLRLLAQGRYRLTPLSDVISAWPITGPRQNQLHRKKLKLRDVPAWDELGARR